MLLREINNNYRMNVSVNDNSGSKNVVASNNKHVQNPRQPFKCCVDAHHSHKYKTTKVGGFWWFCGEKHSRIKNSHRHTTGYAQILSAINVSVDYFDAQ
jgi:hypothetical protein